MKNRFNLVDEPWIPIADVGLVSLRQIFSSTAYRSLGGNPVQKIALTKLLLAIAQAAYTPEDDDNWAKLGTAGMAQKCLDYLTRWHDRFWLYGERPFLQMPQIVAATEQSFGTVVPEVATGNTTVLTASQKERGLSDTERALLIVTLMGFALGGKKTDNRAVLTQGYQGKKNDKGKPSTGKPGTSIGFMGFLHSFLMGTNLQETLWFNLFTHSQLEKFAFYPNGVGIAPWESMPSGEGCEIAQSLRKSLMGRLIPISRFCLLTSNGLHYSEGIYHLNYQEGIVDPSVAVDFSGKKPKVIWVNPEKRPWRYLIALLNFMASNNNGFICYQIQYGLSRVRQNSKTIGIWSGGLKVSSNAGEQYLSGSDDFVESTITLASETLGESWYEQLKYEMSQLDKLAKSLYGATFEFFKSQKLDAEKQAAMACSLFWQLCERKFQALVDACYEHDQAKAMRKHFMQYASKAYDSLCSKATARQLDAWAKSRPNFNWYLS